MTTLQAIGDQIQAAYSISLREGHASWMALAGEGMRVFHVPALPGDGQPVVREKLGAASREETTALEQLGTRITVTSTRPVDEDLLILETEFTGTLPNGVPFSYANTLLYTFRDGEIIRLVEVASEDMWATLRQALQEVGFPGEASAEIHSSSSGG